MDQHQFSPANPPLPVEENRGEQPLRELDSADLLHGSKEILIRHGEEVYRLRLTKNDKLILQK